METLVGTYHNRADEAGTSKMAPRKLVVFTADRRSVDIIDGPISVDYLFHIYVGIF